MSFKECYQYDRKSVVDTGKFFYTCHVMTFVFSDTATIKLPFIKKYVGNSFLQHLKHVRN